MQKRQPRVRLPVKAYMRYEGKLINERLKKTQNAGQKSKSAATEMCGDFASGSARNPHPSGFDFQNLVYGVKFTVTRARLGRGEAESTCIKTSTRYGAKWDVYGRISMLLTRFAIIWFCNLKSAKKQKDFDFVTII